jgi:hypothetical protein
MSKPWKIRLPLLILHKDLEKSSYRVGSDAVITQDILENKSEKQVRTTSRNIESKLADHSGLSDLLLVAAVLIPHGVVHCCLLSPLKKNMSVGIKTPLKISIPDRDQSDPYVFGPPGSGSCNQRSGS